MRKFIFLWFLAVGIISTIGAMWANRSIRLADSNFSDSGLLRYTAEEAARALADGGLPALGATEKRIDPHGKMRFFVFDSSLHEVSGGRVPRAVQLFAAGLRPQDNARFALFGSGLLGGSFIARSGGETYRVVLWFPPRRFARVPIRIWAGLGRLAAIVAGSGLLCSWLAWRLSQPLERLRQAARRFAAGDLNVRAEASTFPANLPEYKELAHDFDEMAGRIQNLVDSQRQLLRDVSHELRTPLTRLSLAVENARHAPANVIQGSLDRIDQESERLNALIGRIIRLSRFETFAEPPRLERIELGDFIESIVSDANFEATAHKRKVSILHAEMCRLEGDRELLREAIENIIRNAIRYTPEGTAVTVDAYCSQPAEYKIVVRDRGPGVPIEHIDAIFEPFYRVPQAKDHDSPGFGIGLAIAKRAIGLHEGTVAARNLDEGGLEIAIRLPVTAQAT